MLSETKSIVKETYRITNLTIRCPKCKNVLRVKVALVEGENVEKK